MNNPTVYPPGSHLFGCVVDIAIMGLSEQFARTLRTEVPAASLAEFTVSRSAARGLFLLVQGTKEELAAARVWIEAHLSARVKHTEHVPSDGYGAAADFYAVSPLR